jgi:hypothetical protein
MGKFGCDSSSTSSTTVFLAHKPRRMAFCEERSVPAGVDGPFATSAWDSQDRPAVRAPLGEASVATGENPQAPSEQSNRRLVPLVSYIKLSVTWFDTAAAMETVANTVPLPAKLFGSNTFTWSFPPGS